MGNIYVAGNELQPVRRDVEIKKTRPYQNNLPENSYVYKYNVSKPGKYALEAHPAAYADPNPQKVSIDEGGNQLGLKYKFWVSNEAVGQ
ncbi:MAG: hypothetical protein QM820_04735 [Minicystis sp.]